MTARVKRIRPHAPDILRSPTMGELAAAERAAVSSGAFRRALAYRLMRVRRLRQAQRGRLG